MKIHFIWNSELSAKNIILEIRNYIKKVSVCSLCSIAYSGIRKKPEWKSLIKRLREQGIESKTHYKNMISKEMKSVAAGNYPVALIEIEGEFKTLLSKTEIDGCQGNIEKFEKLLLSSVQAHKPI